MDRADVCRIVGLDPGLRATGWGVIDLNRSGVVHVANGSIHAPTGGEMAMRLLRIEEALSEVIDTWKPVRAAVERTFVNADGASAIKLAQARAVCLLVPARRRIPVAEYAPSFVKRTVAGSGRADKRGVGFMLRVWMPGVDPFDEDASDALAVAVTAAHAQDVLGRRTSPASARIPERRA